MTELTITYRQSVEAGACREGLRTVGDYLGGWENYGRDTPVSLVTVCDTFPEGLGYWDVLWALEKFGPTRSDNAANDSDEMCLYYGYTERWYRQRKAHLRMVLAGRIRPGLWHTGPGWRS